jgi:hypothetical protein
MGQLVPEWRLREIRNIADTLAYRAACCPVNRLLMLAEEKYLKPGAHIRLLINPRLKIGKAKTYIQHLKSAKCIDADYEVNLYEVTIHFNGDLSSKINWEKTTRAIVKELGWVIFFSPAARWQVLARNKKAFLESFVDAVLKEHPFTLAAIRPRFTLAKLRQIVEDELDPRAKEVLPHLAKLLRQYLGPYGW